MKHDAKNAFQSASNLSPGTRTGIVLGLTFLAAILPALIDLVKNLPVSGLNSSPAPATA